MMNDTAVNVNNNKLVMNVIIILFALHIFKYNQTD